MESIMYDKARKFGIRMVKFSRALLDDNKNKALANQILRSGTSIGANISEGRFSSSRADFINKLRIARKEASETQYWLELLLGSEIIYSLKSLSSFSFSPAELYD